jgi:hypothetical protein
MVIEGFPFLPYVDNPRSFPPDPVNYGDMERPDFSAVPVEDHMPSA